VVVVIVLTSCKMSAKFNTSTAFAVTLTRSFKLVTIFKHSFDDASSASVSSHVLHNTYIVSAHLHSIIIDI
jgi:anthranilate phosphoribosyltransferase